ncbi:MAG: hypothetical protein ACFCUI_06715 [Bernardetiaceae bacterium]
MGTPIKHIAYLLLLLPLLWACEQEAEQTLIEPHEIGAAHTSTITDQEEFDYWQSQRSHQRTEALQSGLTTHFNNWLNANGYGQYNFARYDLEGGSYGGRSYNGEPIQNQPVIFIHGNSDKALGDQPGQTGWTSSIEYFQSQGYKRAEIYAITWGPASAAQSANQYHSRAYLERIRAFIQAVKQYTGASKVDVVAHSMGVTLARKAIKGGSGSDAFGGGTYNLGSRLTYVDAFVGIAGGNQGLVNCYYSSFTPTCGSTNGFYPGYAYGGWGMSQFLKTLNNQSGSEADRIYSIWSTEDQLVGYGGVVWGKYTCQIPNQDAEIRFTSFPYGHFNCKDLTGSEQLNMVKFHQIVQ